MPRPQLTEQSDHTDHGVQPPSTGSKMHSEDLLFETINMGKPFYLEEETQCLTPAVNVLAVMSLWCAGTWEEKETTVCIFV